MYCDNREMLVMGKESEIMSKLLELDLENEEELCNVGKALSSPIRIKILKLLYRDSMIIGEIAKKLDLPTSSAIMHLKVLEEAKLVRIEKQPGTRGNMKLCSRRADHLFLRLLSLDNEVNEIVSVEMPVGRFYDCNVSPTCGLRSEKGIIGMEDQEFSFYLPERVNANLFWTSSGYVEYRFPNLIQRNGIPKKLLFSLEICSEAPGYREDWKSDLTLWINGVECSTWRCPGDFGARRGRRTPADYANGCSQYGILVMWEAREDGIYMNEEKCSNISIDQLKIMDRAHVDIRIGNKEEAKYIGGFNIFGKGIGDYDQDIMLSMEY